MWVRSIAVPTAPRRVQSRRTEQQMQRADSFTNLRERPEGQHAAAAWQARWLSMLRASSGGYPYCRQCRRRSLMSLAAFIPVFPITAPTTNAGSALLQLLIFLFALRRITTSAADLGGRVCPAGGGVDYTHPGEAGAGHARSPLQEPCFPCRLPILVSAHVWSTSAFSRVVCNV